MAVPSGVAALYAGLGCRRGAPASELAGLLRDVMQSGNLPFAALVALASIVLKRQEPGLLQLAADLGLPLHFFNAVQLAPYTPRLSHRSAIAFQHSGCYGVAESSALALAEQLDGGLAELRVERIVRDDMTLALAWIPASGG